MDIKESIGRAYKWPFHVDEDSATIHDDEGNYAITIRGWSRLSELLEHDEAFKLQMEIAHFITNKLNQLNCDHEYGYAVNHVICRICHQIK
jgi:hypothetical protein